MRFDGPSPRSPPPSPDDDHAEMPWLIGTPAFAPAPTSCPPMRSRRTNFTLKDINDRDVSLADYKGKVVLLDFWATWCGPCKVEIPGLHRDAERTTVQQGFQVVGISIDDRADQLKPVRAEMKMNYPVLQGLGRDDVIEAFGPMFGSADDAHDLARRQDLRTHIGLTAKELRSRDQGAAVTRAEPCAAERALGVESKRRYCI